MGVEFESLFGFRQISDDGVDDNECYSFMRFYKKWKIKFVK